MRHRKLRVFPTKAGVAMPAAERVAWAKARLGALPWSPSAHRHFGPEARARAWATLLLAYDVGRRPRFEGQGQALVDVFIEHVVPAAVLPAA